MGQQNQNPNQNNNNNTTQPGTVNTGGGTTVNPNRAVINPNGTTVYPNGMIVYPNGTIVNPDGTVVKPGINTPNTMNSVNRIPTNAVPNTVPRGFTNRPPGLSSWMTNQPQGVYPHR